MTHSSTLIVIPLLFGVTAHAFEVGVASCDITPDVERFDVPMAGYGAREGKPATGVHDPLHAKVLYFRDGATQMAIITTDLRSSTPDLKDQILAKATVDGLTRENVLLAASHNHSGPSFYPERFWQLQFGVYDPEIIEIMSAVIADALNEAIANAQPARAGFAQTDLPDSTRNRRWGYNTEAREAAGETPIKNARLFVMRIDDANGNPRAILVNYPTHPTILGADNFHLSAEWPGVFQRTLEETFPGVTAAYTNGAEGDQAPAGATGDDAFARMEDFGTRLARHAADLVRVIDTAPGHTIAHAYVTPALGEPQFSEAAKDGPYAFMEPMALEALPRHAELQQFRVGPAVFAALPGEPVAAVGMATEAQLARLGVEFPITIGLANDYIGYILDANEYAHGGYEVDSRSYYGPGLGSLIATETARSAAALFGESPQSP